MSWRLSKRRNVPNSVFQAARQKAILPVLFMLLFMTMTPASHAAELLPPGKFADLTLKILTYDRNLKERVHGEIQIGILSSPTMPGNGRKVAAAFDERKDKTVSGFPFTAHRLTWKNPEALDKILKDNDLTCLIVLSDLDKHLNEIAVLTKKYHVLSISSEKEYVNPLSLAISTENNRIRIYRSDKSLKDESIVLSSELLKVTKEK